jgi:ABC-2 type transport system permease protein
MSAAFALVRWSIYARFRELAGYPGWFLLDALIPLIIVAISTFLGRAVGGAQATENFARQAGTPEYAAFLLIGANAFLLTLRAFWDLGLWLRKEQQAGTLEALYVTPADRRWILVGLAGFNLVRGVANLLLSFAIGSLVFGIDPFGRNYPLALAFLAVGAVPLYALSLLYGTLVLRFKEADALIQIAQVALTLLIGVYYPVTILPGLLRFMAYLVPPAWIAGGMRAALLDTAYLLGSWPADLGVLAVMALAGPPLAFAALRGAERALQKRTGIGAF